jgi:hypothetical protein
MERHQVNAAMVAVLAAHPSPDGEEWTQKQLDPAKVGKPSVPHRLIKGELPWTKDNRLVPFRIYLDDQIQKLGRKLSQAIDANNEASKIMYERRIKDQLTIMEVVDEAIKAGGAKRWAKKKRRSSLKSSERDGEQGPLSQSFFDYTWADAPRGVAALLASDFLRHGDANRMRRIIHPQNRQTIQSVRDEMDRRCLLAGLVLEVLMNAAQDSGARLLEAQKITDPNIEFRFRGTVYLLVPPIYRLKDSEESFRLCQVARAGESGAAPRNPVSLSTQLGNDYLAIRAIKTNTFAIGPGQDRGTVRPWITQLVMAHPIRVARPKTAFEASGVVTLDLLVKQGASETTVKKIVAALRWNDHAKIMESRLADSFEKLAKFYAKLLVSGAPQVRC